MTNVFVWYAGVEINGVDAANTNAIHNEFCQDAYGLGSVYSYASCLKSLGPIPITARDARHLNAIDNFRKQKAANTIHHDLNDFEFIKCSTGDTEHIAPPEIDLSQNYPNPLNPITTISYALEIGNFVEILIYNIQGELVTTLVSDYKQPGRYDVTWDGKNNRGSKLPSGVYFYTLKIGDVTSSKKMVLLK